MVDDDTYLSFFLTSQPLAVLGSSGRPFFAFPIWCVVIEFLLAFPNEIAQIV